MVHRAVRILIADDEPAITSTLAEVLKLKAYEVATVNSGEDAVVLARTFLPDIALLDVVLGGISGIVAGQAIARELPECRIILFSGMPLHSSIFGDDSFGVSAFDVLVKPVHPRQLYEVLAAATARTSSTPPAGNAPPA